jgi:hypothetical protein
LRAGNFDGDGQDVLSVGIPSKDIKGIPNAGAVNILKGSTNGLTAENSQIWSEDQPGVKGESEETDYFGYRLATGDFNGDAQDELAVGVYEPIPLITEA